MYNWLKSLSHLQNLLFLLRSLHSLAPSTTCCTTRPWQPSRVGWLGVAERWRERLWLRTREASSSVALINPFRQAAMARACKHAMWFWTQMALVSPFRGHMSWRHHTHMGKLVGWSTWGSPSTLQVPPPALTPTAGSAATLPAVVVKDRPQWPIPFYVKKECNIYIWKT